MKPHSLGLRLPSTDTYQKFKWVQQKFEYRYVPLTRQVGSVLRTSNAIANI